MMNPALASDKASLLKLPEELFQQVVKHLGIKAANRLSQTCVSIHGRIQPHVRSTYTMIEAIGRGSLNDVQECSRLCTFPNECGGLIAMALDAYNWYCWAWDTRRRRLPAEALEIRSKMVKALIFAGADINERTREGRTALIIAIQDEDEEIVNMLLDAGADTNLERTMTGDTALHLATCKEILPMVVNLISAGADIEATDLTGCTALHIAARNGNLSVFNAILNGGADMNRPSGVCGGDNAPPRHITALHYSSWHGHIKIVESLICRDDIAVNATDWSGATALHYAVKQRDIDIVRVLLWHDDIDLNLRSFRWGFTPLHCAVHARVDAVVVLLHKAGFRLGYLQYLKKELRLAKENGRLGHMELLEQKYATAHTWGRPWEESLEDVGARHLIMSQASLLDIHVPDYMGYTALYHSDKFGYSHRELLQTKYYTPDMSTP